MKAVTRNLFQGVFSPLFFLSFHFLAFFSFSIPFFFPFAMKQSPDIQLTVSGSAVSMAADVVLL